MVRSAITLAEASSAPSPASTKARAAKAMPPSWVMGRTSDEELRNCRAAKTMASGMGRGSSGMMPDRQHQFGREPRGDDKCKPAQAHARQRLTHQGKVEMHQHQRQHTNAQRQRKEKLEMFEGHAMAKIRGGLAPAQPLR